MYVVSQKSLTGHSKGDAAVFQISGIGQILRDGVLPANKSLDCVDQELEKNPWLVWLRDPLEIGKVGPVKAALLTSLGFGHVSSLLALVHPGAFQAAVAKTLGQDEADRWSTRALKRLEEGARRIESGMLRRADLFAPTAHRRLPEEGGDIARDVEAAMLLNPHARLGNNGSYA